VNIEVGDCLIEARDVHRSFGQTPALRGVSIGAARGEILAVMGPSGSGKSTLLHCLAGIFQPDSGGVWFNGKRIDDLSDKKRTLLRRSAFGFVFQFGQLVPELTAADNIAIPLVLARSGRRAAYRAADSWLGRLGLGELGVRRTGELSGGEAQRVAIGRALIARPQVLFADEPTGSLDSANGRMIMDVLVGIARQDGTTVILVTHDSAVAAYADRAVSVSDGQLAGAEVGGPR